MPNPAVAAYRRPIIRVGYPAVMDRVEHTYSSDVQYVPNLGLSETVLEFSSQDPRPTR